MLTKPIPRRMLAHTLLLSALTITVVACGSNSSNTASSNGWPNATLAAAAATTVVPDQFLSADQLNSWGTDLDSRGLRDTGGPAHEAYIDELYKRLSQAGVQQLHFESVPLTRWSVSQWSLNLVTGSDTGTVPTASYVPYSGETTVSGITAPLVYLSSGTTPSSSNVAGKIVVFDVPAAAVPMGYFTGSAMRSYDPDNTVSPQDTYARSYLAISAVTTELDQLQAAGAAGAIGVIAAPAATANGTYFPYDRKLRNVPSLFVDQVSGARLKAAANGVNTIRLTLPAEVRQVTTRNIVGIIPGASDELTVINSHSDGTNGIEDNGPNAIVAMAQYLTRLPQQSLPRSIMVLITSGHLAGGVGAESFLSTHKDDGLLARIASITTVEHMGAQEWLPDSNGLLAATGKPEFAAFFMPPIRPMVDAAYTALQSALAAPSYVLPPLNPGGDGTADDAVWPGEGQYFWGEGMIPTGNYITGPAYLLNYGVTTADKIDFNRMRQETIAFTQMLLDLSRVAKTDLGTLDPTLLN